MKRSTFIKIIALALSMIFVISALVACNPSTGDGESSTPPSNEPKALTIGGVDISEFVIVYGNSEPTAKQRAGEISEAIYAISGVTVITKSDEAKYVSGKEILVGHTNRTTANGVAKSFYTATAELEADSYVMYTDGDFFFLGGAKGDNVAITAAANKLVADIKETESGALVYASAEPVKAESFSLYRVMTYNDGGNVVTNPTNVANFILEFKPDIVGMQEVQEFHAKQQYPALLKNYGVVYYDHDDTKYGAPILYNKNRFDLVDSGTQWLSDTPDEFGSSYPESAYIRSYVFAILADKETGEEIVVVNTHIDYKGEANKKQVAKLLELTERFEDKTIIYTADWNMKVSAEGFALMNAAGYTDGGNAYGKPIPDSGNYIDFIFVDTSEVTVNYYEYLTNHKYSAGRPLAASDHSPVIVDVAIFHN